MTASLPDDCLTVYRVEIEIPICDGSMLFLVLRSLTVVYSRVLQQEISMVSNFLS